MKTVVGLFDQFSDAQNAVRDLEGAGFERRHISIIANRGDQSDSMGTAERSGDAGDAGDTAGGAATGAMVGGAVGLIAGLAALAIPGIGPVLAMGPLATALTGAGVGA